MILTTALEWIYKCSICEYTFICNRKEYREHLVKERGVAHFEMHVAECRWIVRKAWSLCSPRIKGNYIKNR